MGMSLIALWVMGASLKDSFVSDDWWHTYKGFRFLTATHSLSCSKTINRFDLSGCMQFVITLLVHKLLFFSSESQDVKGSRYSFPALSELVTALQICTRPNHLFSCWCCSSQNSLNKPVPQLLFHGLLAIREIGFVQDTPGLLVWATFSMSCRSGSFQV